MTSAPARREQIIASMMAEGIKDKEATQAGFDKTMKEVGVSMSEE